MKNIFLALVFAFSIYGCSVHTSQNLFDSEIKKENFLRMSNNYQELIRIYQEKLALRDLPGDRLKLAQLYYDIKDYNSALYYLQPLLDSQKTEQPLLLKAKILEAQDEFQQALDTVNEALKIEPKLAQAWNIKGIIFANNGYYEEAKKSFFAAKDLFLDDCIVNTNLGSLEILQENYPEAISYFAPLYLRGCKNINLIHDYIFALVKNSNYELASKIISDEGISKNPKNLIIEITKVNPNNKNNTQVSEVSEGEN